MPERANMRPRERWRRRYTCTKLREKGDRLCGRVPGAKRVECVPAATLERRAYWRALYVKILYQFCVRLDEFFARHNLVSHENGKDIVCGFGVFDSNTFQYPSLRIHRRFP